MGKETLLCEPRGFSPYRLILLEHWDPCGGGRCSGVERPPSAQGVTPGSRIESRVGLPTWSLLLPLPGCLYLSVCLCVSHE